MYVAANSPAANGGPGDITGICDVHRLLYGDHSARLVRFCGLCQAWLCAQCRRAPVKRIQAAIKQLRGN